MYEIVKSLIERGYDISLYIMLNKMYNIFFYETDIGIIGIRENGKSITNIYFSKINNSDNIEETNLIKDTFEQIQEYLQGKRNNFNLPLDPEGTEFQKRVWSKLLEIPYGQTRTYKDTAIAIGNEKACRAIGMANNKNPIPIIIPCHRVIGSNGKLVGYAGGLNIKEKLLNIEKIDVNKGE